MARIRLLQAIALLVLVLGGTAFAQKKCTPADEANAMKAADRVSSWPTLNSTWKTYRHCDSGAVADQFTEALLRLIVDWKHMDQLATAMKDPEYDDFILEHLRSPAAKNDAEDVFARAKASCPKGMAEFCARIAQAVDQTPLKPIAMEPAAPPAPPAKK